MYSATLAQQRNHGVEQQVANTAGFAFLVKDPKHFCCELVLKRSRVQAEEKPIEKAGTRSLHAVPVFAS
jgi:hypothetical protein